MSCMLKSIGTRSYALYQKCCQLFVNFEVSKKIQRSLWAAPLRHSRIKNGNGASCKFSFSAEMAQKVNLRPMEFVYRAPVVRIVDANLAILSSDLHSGDK